MVYGCGRFIGLGIVWGSGSCCINDDGCVDIKDCGGVCKRGENDVICEDWDIVCGYDWEYVVNIDWEDVVIIDWEDVSINGWEDVFINSWEDVVVEGCEEGKDCIGNCKE